MRRFNFRKAANSLLLLFVCLGASTLEAGPVPVPKPPKKAPSPVDDSATASSSVVIPSLDELFNVAQAVGNQSAALSNYLNVLCPSSQNSLITNYTPDVMFYIESRSSSVFELFRLVLTQNANKISCITAIVGPDQWVYLAQKYVAHLDTSVFTSEFCDGLNPLNGLSSAPGTPSELQYIASKVPGLTAQMTTDLESTGRWKSCVKFSAPDVCALYTISGQSLYGSSYAYITYVQNGTTLQTVTECLSGLSGATSPGLFVTQAYKTSVLPWISNPSVNPAHSNANDFRFNSSLLINGGTRLDGTIMTQREAAMMASESNLMSVAAKLRSTLFSDATMASAGIDLTHRNYVNNGRSALHPRSTVFETYESVNNLPSAWSDLNENIIHIPLVSPTAGSAPVAVAFMPEVFVGELATIYEDMLTSAPTHFNRESDFFTDFPTTVSALLTDSLEQAAAYFYKGGSKNASNFQTVGNTKIVQIYKDYYTQSRSLNHVNCAASGGGQPITGYMNCDQGLIITTPARPDWIMNGTTLTLETSRRNWPATWNSNVVGATPTGMDYEAPLIAGVFIKIGQFIGDDNAWKLLLAFLKQITDNQNLKLSDVGPKIRAAALTLWPGSVGPNPIKVLAVEDALLFYNLNIDQNVLPQTSMTSRGEMAFTTTDTCRGAGVPSGSSILSAQPSYSAQSNTIDVTNRYTNCYNVTNADYVVAQIGAYSELGYKDRLMFFDNNSALVGGLPTPVGNIQFVADNMLPISNMNVIVGSLQGDSATNRPKGFTFSHERTLASLVEANFGYQLDVNSMGYQIKKVIPNGFAHNPWIIGSATAYTKMVDFTPMDPSADIKHVTQVYRIQVMLSSGEVFDYSSNSANHAPPVPIPSDTYLVVVITRAANASINQPAYTNGIRIAANDIGVRPFVAGTLPNGTPVNGAGVGTRSGDETEIQDYPIPHDDKFCGDNCSY